MQGREIRRSFTLSEQLAGVEPFILRDFLKLRDDDEVGPSTVVVPCEMTEAFAAGSANTGRGRTLLDVIREESENGGVVAGANSGNGIGWKTFMDHLRRAGTLWASASSSSWTVRANPIAERKFYASVSPHSILLQPTSRSISVPVNGNNPSTADSTATIPPTTSPPEGAADGIISIGQESSPAAAAEPPASSTHEASGEGQQVGLSLMAMLEQTDRHWGNGEETPPPPPPALLAMAMMQEEDDVADDEIKDVGEAKFYPCCVCMARRKGAAFIPCGHTFCRPCSRELWVSRGNCPICNVFILEILDIF